MKRLTVFCTCTLLICAIPVLCPADNTDLRISPLFEDGREEKNLHLFNEEAVIFPSEEDRDYEETELRRFEIVFFVSLPASILFSIAGIGMHRAGSGRSGGFILPEYGYLVFSSVGISFSIALHDNRVVFKKTGM